MLSQDFYMADAVSAASLLLGCLLVHDSPDGLTSGVIVETEAYAGPEDKGAHSHHGRTSRTEIQFGPGGFAYVFRIYGMYSCFNVVTGGENQPHVVLVRALEPVDGTALMARRRGTDDPLSLCSGPGKLCQAMGIGSGEYGLPLWKPPLYIEPYRHVSQEQIMVSPRINIDYAEEYAALPWRFYLSGSPYVSKTARKYTERSARLSASRPPEWPVR